MLILGEEKGKLLNQLSRRKGYYDYLEVLRQVLSLTRTYYNNGEKLLDAQILLSETIILFENKAKESSSDEDVFMFKQLRAIAKSITDGVLWRETNYNRPYVSMLSYAKGPGNIKEDIANTIKQIRKNYLSENNIILISDVSNFIRIGDYIIMEKGKITDILEVKGKNIRGIKYYKNKKTGKQSGKMVETFKQLHKYPIRNISIKTNYFEQLKNSIKISYEKGYHTSKLNKYTFVRVIYHQNFKNADKLINETKKLKSIIKETNKDEIAITSNYDFYVNKHNRYSTSVIAPYSIFPLDNMTCIYLMSGILQVTTYVNVSGIKREFQKENWIIEDVLDSVHKSDISDENDINASNMFYENNVDMSLFKIKKDDGYFSYFSISELQLIAFEFKSYKSIIENHNQYYEESKIDISSNKYLLNFDSDKEVFL